MTCLGEILAHYNWAIPHYSQDIVTFKLIMKRLILFEIHLRLQTFHSLRGNEKYVSNLNEFWLENCSFSTLYISKTTTKLVGFQTIFKSKYVHCSLCNLEIIGSFLVKSFGLNSGVAAAGQF